MIATMAELPRNDQLAEQFELLGDLMELEGADLFRINAYRKAAARIRETPSSTIDHVGVDGDDDFEIRPAVAGVSDLFAEPERSSPWVNRLVAIGCFAAIVLAIGIGLTTFGSRTASSSAAPLTMLC
jgi:hypothetical protein